MEVDQSKERKKDYSLFTIEPRSVKHGGWLLIIIGLIKLVYGLISLAYGLFSSLLVLTLGCVTIIFGLFAVKKEAKRYIYFGIVLLLIDIIVTLSLGHNLIIDAGGLLFKAWILWELIKLIPAYANFYKMQGEKKTEPQQNNKDKRKKIIKYIVILIFSLCILPFMIDSFIMVFTNHFIRIPGIIALFYPDGPIGLFMLVGGCILTGLISKFDEIKVILNKIFPAGITSNKTYIIGLILTTAGNLWMTNICKLWRMEEFDFLANISSLIPLFAVIFLFFGELQAKIKNINEPIKGFTVALNFLNLFLFLQISIKISTHINYYPIILKNIHFFGILATIVLALGYLSAWLYSVFKK